MVKIVPLPESIGMEGTQMARMGEYEVLLSFVDTEKALQALKDFEFDFSQYFVELAPWEPRPSISKRRVWLKCYSVPLQACDSKVFKEIEERLGEEVSAAKETSEKGTLEFGRVCIQLERNLFINQEVGIVVYSISFMVSVREELESQMVVVGKSQEPEGAFFFRCNLLASGGESR